MKTISIPYYTSTLDLHVDEANLKAVVTAKMHEYKAGKTEVELVHEALEHPIASPRLRDLAKGKQKVVLVTSDHTRAVPSKITLPILLDEIRQGNPDADITILIATGLHRPTTEEEQRRMFGDAIVDHETIAINNAVDLDLFGQVNAESAGIKHISGAGGQLDFVLGAYLSKGGKSFICCSSTFKKKDGTLESRIVPTLAPGSIVTDTRANIHYLVTEYGKVNLKGLSTWQKTEAIISVAHPQFRDQLIAEAEKMHIWRASNKR